MKKNTTGRVKKRSVCSATAINLLTLQGKDKRCCQLYFCARALHSKGKGGVAAESFAGTKLVSTNSFDIMVT